MFDRIDLSIESREAEQSINHSIKMPVSARIADIVKREAGDQADEIGKQSKPAKSAKAIEQSLKQESSSNEPAS